MASEVVQFRSDETRTNDINLDIGFLELANVSVVALRAVLDGL